MRRRRRSARDPGLLRLDRVPWPRPRLPRLGTGMRWLTAVALVGLAAVLLSAAPSSAREPTTAVLVAARDLSPGVALRATDVRSAELPRTLVPDGALRPGFSLSGRRLTAPARRGQPLTDVSLMGPALLRASASAAGSDGAGGTGSTGADAAATSSGSNGGTDPGTSPGSGSDGRAGGDQVVAAPVRMADPGTLALVRPGDRVDVLAARTDDVGVGSAVPPATVVARDVLLLTTGSTDDDAADPGTLVVVATDPATAARLAADAVHSRLSLTVHGR